MRFACLLLTLTAVSFAGQDPPAKPGIPLKTSLAGHFLVVDEIFLNGVGPFRMLVDTGNASCVIRPELARRLNLQAAYAVDQVSVAGVHRVPVAILDEVRAGGISDRSVEAMVADVVQAGVDGVLGESWLVRHDYLLDYRNRRMALDGGPLPAGSRLPLRSSDGRPVVIASIDGHAQELVVDSGASALVLFGRPAVGATVTARLESDGGAVRGEKCSVQLALSGSRDRLVEAVRLDVRGQGAGLLPAGAFAAVFVSNREGYVEFRR